MNQRLMNNTYFIGVSVFILLPFILILITFIVKRYSVSDSANAISHSLERVIQMQKKKGGFTCHIDHEEKIYTCFYVEEGEM